jgi:protein-tyrosine phosphatase
MDRRPFRILTVCQGNISRSPAAEHLLRAQLGPRFAVASAGTQAHAVVGSGVDRWTRALLSKRGVDASRHASRQLTGQMIDAAELILTMTPRQRSWVLTEAPTAMRRVFTLVEFARLAVAVRGQRPGSVSDAVRRAAASRAVYPVGRGGTDAIADPHGGSVEDYRTAFAAVEDASIVVAAELSRYDRLRSAAPAQPFAGFVL